jgi:pimeloyl-ACP methyl ester carboxylesterase
VKRAGALLVLALAFAACGGDDRPQIETASGLLPGSVVEADGHRVYFRCEGTGSPSVVFLNGWGVDASSWVSVFDGASRMARACVYDRAGLGESLNYSRLPRRPRDAHDQVRELEQLLDNGKIEKPYVLVGHSWGGALARLYAGTHDDVQAVVLVDSSSPGQDAALLAGLPVKEPGESALLAELRKPHDAAVDNPEYLDWGKSLREVGEVTSLGDLPEIVITAGASFPASATRLFPTWLRLQNRLASLSSKSIHMLARRSTHFVQQDAPDPVLAAIRAAVNAVRDDGRLVPCTAMLRGTSGVSCLR